MHVVYEWVGCGPWLAYSDLYCRISALMGILCDARLDRHRNSVNPPSNIVIGLMNKFIVGAIRHKKESSRRG